MTPTKRKAMEQALAFCEAWPGYGGIEAADALRNALAEPVVEPSHKLIYPGGGKSLFDKLWHLTCNAVATQSGMRVRTDVLPMIEMREFLHYLCALVDSPPSAPPAEVPLLSDEEIGALVREASKGGALNRDGSTSQRIARAIEQVVRQNAGLK